MELVLEVSDEVATGLKVCAASRGQSIERLVESWLVAERERDAVFNRVHELRETLYLEHGFQPDCVPLIREDRERESAFDEVDTIKRHISRTYGRQPESVDSIREDRGR